MEGVPEKHTGPPAVPGSMLLWGSRGLAPYGLVCGRLSLRVGRVKGNACHNLGQVAQPRQESEYCRGKKDPFGEAVLLRDVHQAKPPLKASHV